MPRSQLADVARPATDNDLIARYRAFPFHPHVNPDAQEAGGTWDSFDFSRFPEPFVEANADFLAKVKAADIPLTFYRRGTLAVIRLYREKNAFLFTAIRIEKSVTCARGVLVRYRPTFCNSPHPLADDALTEEMKAKLVAEEAAFFDRHSGYSKLVIEMVNAPLVMARPTKYITRLELPFVFPWPSVFVSATEHTCQATYGEKRREIPYTDFLFEARSQATAEEL